MKKSVGQVYQSLLKGGRRLRPIILCLIGLLLLAESPAKSGSSAEKAGLSRNHFEFTRVENWDGVSDFFAYDFDGDGVEDLLRLFSGNRAYHVNRFCRERVLGPALYQANAVNSINGLCPIDIDTIPGYEIGLIMKDPAGDSLWVEVYQGAKKNLLCRTQAVIGQDISPITPGWDGGAGLLYPVDLDDDGRMELILPVNVGHDLYPRGVYVYDYPSGRLKWWFPLAGAPLRLSVADVNRDGFQEVYVKTFACCNGAVVGDRSDTLAYIHALDHLGHILWSQTLGDRFDLTTGEPYICDCDTDGVVEMYYTMLLHSDEFDQNVWTLQKRRAKDNFFINQLSLGANQEFWRIYSGRFGDNGESRLLTDKNLCLIDPVTLETISCGAVKNGQIQGIENLDVRDDRPEILLTKKDSLYICDADLEIVGSLTRENSNIIKADYLETPFGDRYLLILSDIPGERSNRILDVYKMEYVSDIFGGIPWTTYRALIGGVVIGLIPGAFVGFMLVRRRQPKSTRHESHTAQYSNLLTSLVNFNHGRMAGKNLNRLVFLFSNLPEAPNKLNEIKPNLKAATEAYQSFTSSQLQSIIDNAQRIRPIKSDIHRLEKQMHRLSAVMMNMNIAELAPDQAPELRKAIPDIIGNIQSDIRRVREYLQTHFSANLLRTVTGVLAAAAGQFQEQGVGFTKITVRGKTSQSIFFDESELAAVFEELLSNACDAMAESEKKELTLDVTYENSEVVILLSDSGHGLQTDDPDQIFNRDYSTRGSNRGYGLFQARQLVEHFGGTIRYYNNETGSGATVELVLRTVNHG